MAGVLLLCYTGIVMFTIFGDTTSRFLKKNKKTVDAINALESEVALLADADFPLKTLELKDRLQKGETIESVTPYAFALVREAAKRVLGQRHYDVQLLGGLTILSGSIAEMRTGEGKTLVATLPTYTRALLGGGVHVVTVNDYLARRDATWMGQIYAFLGMSVGIINTQNVSYIYDPTHTDKADDTERDTEGSFKVTYEFLRPCSRKDAYAADITYGTNNEFGFDYLRDNLVGSLDAAVQRGYASAIVDEIDSILIDEARTPLIISSPVEDSESLYETCAAIARELTPEIDYTIDEKLRAIQLTDAGITRAEKKLGVENIYTEKGIKYVHHLETAVRATALFKKDKDYVVQNSEVVIVDASTGRLMQGRRYNDGLHQALEAKEGVTVQKESRTVASITFQNYFRLYTHLAGMTGTAKTSSEEFFKVYGLEVITVPTHLSIARVDHVDLIYQSEEGKFKAIAQKIKALHTKGQPVLIGTISIEKNELLSAYLKGEGVPHTILNAKNHEQEGEIVAGAGKKGAVTIATNMAGRGVDIKLGGALATKEEAEEVKNLGGLFVLGTERHEARRIDNQLRGRAGRQGDPGETQFFVSLEDDLMRVFASDRIKNMMGRFNIPEDQPIENVFVSRALEGAQEKIEGFYFDARKYTLEYDTVLTKQREAVYTRRRSMLENNSGAVETVLGNIAQKYEGFEQVVADKKTVLGETAFLEAVRRSILYVTDVLWVDHLETMEYTRQSVNLRAYGQREPLIEYKKEGLTLFKMMEERFLYEVKVLVETLNGPAGDDIHVNQTTIPLHAEPAPFEAAADRQNGGVISSGESKVGRNDPCPCGSGKKYKKCHGANE